ncbi:MAG: hypothetical protein OXN27_00855 [Candidatus Poribacteria bacterium]|nr:hypothetical protein [Candidatus Poribacteria bacterium]
MLNHTKYLLGQRNYYLHLLAALLFLSAVLAMTWPLAYRLNTHVLTGSTTPAVPHLNLWTLAWNHHSFGSVSESYWDANQFHPFPKVLAYSEPQFGTAVLTLPLVILGATTTQAYNLVLLAFIWGTGMATYLLCWYLFTEMTPKIGHWIRWISAVIAGILLGLNSYVFREIGVIQLLALPFLPLTLLGLHRFFSQKKWQDAVLLILGILGSWYTCAHYGLFLSIFIVCFVIFFSHRELLDWRTMIKAFVVVITIAACLIPLAHAMFSAKSFILTNRPEWLVFVLSANFRHYFTLPQSSLLYNKILGTGSQYSLFLGGMLMLLAGVGIVTTFQICASQDTGFQRNGPARWSLRRYKYCYITMAAVAFLLSFGVALLPLTSTGMGPYKILRWLSPYYLLYKFAPGFSAIRSVGRFSIFCVFFLSILAGWGVLWFLQRSRTQFRWILAFLIISLTTLEVWPTPLRLIRVPDNSDELPRIYQHVSRLPRNSILLEFPMQKDDGKLQHEMDAQYLYRSTFHWLRLVNGYSGFSPKASGELTDLFTQLTPAARLSALREFGVQYVLTHGNMLTDEEIIQLRSLETEGLRPLFREGSDVLYKLDEGEIETPGPHVEAASFSIYESKRSRQDVTLCLYYEVNVGEALLTTAWKNPIEWEMLWYKDVPKGQQNTDPVLMNQGAYRGSKLMIPGMNAIEITVPAPPPGQYEVVVRPQSVPDTLAMSGICQLDPTGLVIFKKNDEY